MSSCSHRNEDHDPRATKTWKFCRIQETSTNLSNVCQPNLWSEVTTENPPEFPARSWEGIKIHSSSANSHQPGSYSWNLRLGSTTRLSRPPARVLSPAFAFGCLFTCPAPIILNCCVLLWPTSSLVYSHTLRSSEKQNCQFTPTLKANH